MALRANFSAASMASAPEFRNTPRPNPGQCCAEKRAARVGLLHKLPVHHGVQVLVQLCLQLIVDRGVAMAKLLTNAADRVKQLGAVGQMNPRSTGSVTSRPKGCRVVEAKPRLKMDC